MASQRVTVADPGSKPLTLWIDPVLATILHPELGYTDSVLWSATATYPKDTVVEYEQVLYRAYSDPPIVGDPPDRTEDWRAIPGAWEQNVAVEIALAQATWMLDALTRGKLHGVECWIEDYIVRSCTITLLRQPVANIKTVTVVRDCGRIVEPMPFTAWCQIAMNSISVCCDGCGFAQSPCGCSNTMIRVEYQIGSNLPPGTQAMVAWLANEFLKSATGKPCALPDRVTSISRQGVSWTMLDPMEFLDKGMTGVGRIDQWLATIARSLGTGVWIDPLHSNRVFSEQRPCDGSGEFGDEDVTDPVPDPFSKAFKVGGIP